LGILRGLRTWLALNLVQQILKYRAVALKPNCAYVGEVVGNSRQLFILSGQSGFTDIKCSVHNLISC
jgi:hypothetical protein